MKFLFLLIFALFCSLPAVASTTDITRERTDFQGQSRTYYLYVPESVSSSRPSPLLVLLHGSRRNGLSLVERWKEIADQEGIILVGPDSTNSSTWQMREDGTDFLHHLIEQIKSARSINPRRVYLFGHSAGAIFALYMSLLESEYFAAITLHAGAMYPQDYSIINYARRKIPIAMFVGTNDPLFPLPAVRATRDELNRNGFSVQLTEIRNDTHNYYGRAPEINRSAWDFLKSHELAADPRFERYQATNQ